jgi:hypothetical protein
MRATRRGCGPRDEAARNTTEAVGNTTRLRATRRGCGQHDEVACNATEAAYGATRIRAIRRGFGQRDEDMGSATRLRFAYLNSLRSLTPTALASSNDVHRESHPSPVASLPPLPSAIRLPRGEGTRWGKLSRESNIESFSPPQREKVALNAVKGRMRGRPRARTQRLPSPHLSRQRHSPVILSEVVGGCERKDLKLRKTRPVPRFAHFEILTLTHTHPPSLRMTGVWTQPTSPASIIVSATKL